MNLDEFLLVRRNEREVCVSLACAREGEMSATDPRKDKTTAGLGARKVSEGDDRNKGSELHEEKDKCG